MTVLNTPAGTGKHRFCEDFALATDEQLASFSHAELESVYENLNAVRTVVGALVHDKFAGEPGRELFGRLWDVLSDAHYALGDEAERREVSESDNLGVFANQRVRCAYAVACDDGSFGTIAAAAVNAMTEASLAEKRHLMTRGAAA